MGRELESRILEEVRSDFSPIEAALEPLGKVPLMELAAPEVAIVPAGQDVRAKHECNSQGVADMVNKTRRSSHPDLSDDLLTLQVLDHLKDGITLWDASQPGFPLVYANNAFLNMTGYTRDDLEGQSCNLLQGGNPGPQVMATFQAALCDNKPTKSEFLDRRKDGRPFWNQLTLTPLVDAAGRVTRLLGVQNDITAMVEKEEAVKEKVEEEAASQAKSLFLANMSHEIRTPLNGMLGMARVLLGSPLDTDQRDAVEIMLECGSNLLGILDNILELSKIDHGSTQLDYQLMCLRSTLEACVVTVAPEAEKKGLALTYLLDPEVITTHYVADTARVRQVLVHLLTNAVKFTETGGVTVSVGVDQQGPEVEDISPGAPGPCQPGPSTDLIHIRVEDTGIGLPSNLHEVIFECFRQGAESLNRKYGGQGLGLAISRRLARVMGGDLWVESKEGQGSVFHFTFSVQCAGANETCCAPCCNTGSEGPILQGRKVLLDVPHASLSGQVAQSCRALGMNVVWGDVADPHTSRGEVDIVVTTVGRTPMTLKAGWKWHPIVSLGSKGDLVPYLQPLVVVVREPVQHHCLAAGLAKALMVAAPLDSQTNTSRTVLVHGKYVSWRQAMLQKGERRSSLDNSKLSSTWLADRSRGAQVSGSSECIGGGTKAAPQIGVENEGAASEPPKMSTVGPAVQGVPSPSTPSSPNLEVSPFGSSSSLSSDDVPLVVEQECPPPSPPRILIAEDNKINQLVVKKVLCSVLGSCEPTVVSNGLEVLEALSSQVYDIILMDIHMPEMDGLEASRRIQQLYPAHQRPRIIALSADTLHALKEQCFAAGMEQFISKPFRVDDIRRVLRGPEPTLQPRVVV